VGIYVAASRPVAASEMVVGTATTGWSADIYTAAEGPPDELNGWTGPVGSIEGASDEETATLEVAEPATFYLLWITDLGDNESVQINEIAVRG
jgi:hypothetical protein